MGLVSWIKELGRPQSVSADMVPYAPPASDLVRPVVPVDAPIDLSPVPVKERKASRASAAILSTVAPRQPLWMKQDYQTFAREGYGQNVYVFRAINMLAEALAEMPLALFAKSKRGVLTKIHRHPLLDFMDYPNPLAMNGADFFMKHYAYYCISGNSYLEKIGPSDGPPQELWTHRPDRMMVLPGTAAHPIAGYRFNPHASTSGATMSPDMPLFPAEAILHSKTFHPWDDWYGQSPMSAGARSIDSSNASKAWNVAQLQNDGRPSGIFRLKEGTFLSEPEWNDLRRLIAESYQGSRNARRPLLLEADVDFQAISQSPADMDWMAGQQLSRDEVALAWGVPPELLASGGDKVRKNDDCYKFFYTSTVMPMMRRFIGGLNRFVVRDFGADLVLTINEEKIQALQEDRATLWDMANGATCLTENEKRAMLGYDAAPWGDVRVFPSSMVEVAEDGTVTVLNPMSGQQPGAGPGGSGGAGPLNGGGRPKKPGAPKKEIPLRPTEGEDWGLPVLPLAYEETETAAAVDGLSEKLARVRAMMEPPADERPMPSANGNGHA